MSRDDRLTQRRVVVTGLGVVSPNGMGTDAYENSLAPRRKRDRDNLVV